MTDARLDRCGPGRRRARLVAACFTGMAPFVVAAQDASRGAQLYLQLPAAASCVSCHGPDPSQGRNNLLRAADQPLALQRALSTVGVMGYLKPLLADADVADIAAYLGAVLRAAAPDSPVDLWPVTAEFGTLAPGSVSPVQTVVLRNAQAAGLPLAPPRIEGPAAAGVLLDTDCPALLAPAAECRVRLRAQPLAAGPAAAALVLASGTAAPWVVGLSFTARAGAVAVLSTDLAQDTLDFGTAPAGESVQRSFRLVNHGTASTTLGVITLTGPGRTAFRLEGPASGTELVCTAGTTLAPGGSCTMRLGFAAGITGDFRAGLQWRGDATQPANLALRGAVTAAPSPPPPAAPVSPTAPTAGPPPVEAPAGGGGCSAGPAVRRVDPVLPLLIAVALAGLGLRLRRGAVTVPSPGRHGAFTGPAYRP